mgnify:CR=1 FL=1
MKNIGFWVCFGGLTTFKSLLPGTLLALKMTDIQEVLAFAKADKSQLSAIAISKGPGSYTGLRIGVSAAKGLSYALDIPLISIPTLLSLAHQVRTEEGYIIPMLDARRMEVYSAVFDNDYGQVRETQAQVLDEQSFRTYLDENTVTFIGNGVAKFKEICKHPNARFVDEKLPSAAQMCRLAQEKLNLSDFEDVAYFEPYYLKDSIAGKSKMQ